MSNHILSITLRDHSLIPAEAEVRITVVPAFLDAATEVRGRLMGPRCRFASTVEVAYHLRPLVAQPDHSAITLRAIIPEASLWEPQSPHLYSGPIELWQGGQRCEVKQVRHGLRHVALGSRGLRLNGRPYQLRGKEVTTLDEGTALALRESGYNLVVTPVEEATTAIWEVADRIGFFVLGRITQESELTRQLAGHPSCLGWLMGEEGVIQGQDEGGRFAATRTHLDTPRGDLPALVLSASSEANGKVDLGVVE